MKDILDITGPIARAVRIPVMADIDTGGGNDINAATITERLIEMGIAGVNIEDQVFPKRCGHMVGKQVIDPEEMAGKVRAMADVRRRRAATSAGALCLTMILGIGVAPVLAYSQGLNGTPGPIRTADLLLRRQTLYPAELRAQEHHQCIT